MNNDDSLIGNELDIFRNDGFSNWFNLNDTIMGGSSVANCFTKDEGLHMEGVLIEEGGGFISCKSPYFKNELDLSTFKGIKLEIDGFGRIFKLAISCNKNYFGIPGLNINRIRWVSLIPTELDSTTLIKIPFREFKPALRAKPVLLPLPLNTSRIREFQLLYSKFGMPGKLNPEFTPGNIKVILRSISAYS